MQHTTPDAIEPFFQKLPSILRRRPYKERKKLKMREALARARRLLNQYRCPLDEYPVEFECPDCNISLSNAISFPDPRNIVPILGGAYSGKTTLLLSLVHSLEYLSSHSDRDYHIFNKAGREYIDEVEQSLMNCAPTDSFSAPICIHSTGPQSLYRIFYDVAGSFMFNDFLKSKLHLIVNRPYIVLLVDPFSIPAFESFLPDLPESQVRTSQSASANKVMAFLLQAFRAHGIKYKKQPVDTELFIVLTRAEFLEKVAVQFPDTTFGNISKQLFNLLQDATLESSLNTQFFARYIDEAQALEDWLQSEQVNMYPLVTQAKNSFKRVRYFVHSTGIYKRDRTSGLMNTDAYSVLGSLPLLDALFAGTLSPQFIT